MGPQLWVGCCALALATGCATYTRPAAANRPAPTDRTETPDFTSAAGAATQSVVYIRTTRSGSESNHGPVTLVGGGTGVVIDARGVILTSAHVVDGATAVHVYFADGRGFPALRVELCEQLDLALIRISAAGVAELHAVAAAEAPAGPVCAIAAVPHSTQNTGMAAVGFRMQLRTGRVLQQSVNLQEQIDPVQRRTYADLLETDIQIEPGYSGGPLLTPDGRLVGIDVARARVGTAPRAYAIPWTPQTRREIESLLLATR